ncbi:sugar ABC transporter ATP-binding protein [Aestuariivirga sp.]|uniref:sugar ABC transporter ATP-binding protein n=1 Tax=Aestuariivirga sp. TaxID=2650926 RepID=UPI0035940410
MASAFLELDGISKRFGPVSALENVSLHVAHGEVVGLLGENGAGKSTLMKILGGVHQPSSGSLSIDGKKTIFASPRQSMGAGIAFVHQELNSFGNLDVAANILIGREPRKGPGKFFVDRAESHRIVQPLLERLRADFSPSTLVGNLSIAQRQLLEIARALSLNARIVIMDEPTSSLTLSESKRLLEIVRELRRDGVSVIFITHRLNEIVEIADRVIVLRDGKLAGTLGPSEISAPAMIDLMIGRSLQNLYAPPSHATGEAGLEIRHLRTSAYPDAKVSLTVRKGEILGLAGLIGAGRSETARAIFGVDPILSGEILINGVSVQITSPRQAMTQGVALVPEDRKQSGLLLNETIIENIGLANWKSFSKHAMIKAHALRDYASVQIASFDIHASGPDARLNELSGGNQQKVVLAKWLPRKPRVLICDEPTRGVDVGARHDIYDKLRAASDGGAAVLLISSDMEEVLGVSDRIAVMHEGRISGILERHQFSEQNVLKLAVGRQGRKDDI